MKKSIFILLSIIFFSGCTSSDSGNSSSTYEYPTRLIGRWAMIKEGVLVNNLEQLAESNCDCGLKFNVATYSYIDKNENGTYNNPINPDGTWQIVNNDEIIMIYTDTFGVTQVFKIKTLNSTTLKLYGISSTGQNILDKIYVLNKIL